MASRPDGRAVVADAILVPVGTGNEFGAELEEEGGSRVWDLAALGGGPSKTRSSLRSTTRRRLADVVLHDYVPKETTPSVLAAATAIVISLTTAGSGS